MDQDICVIVPTIREYDCMLKYFENARKHGFDLSRIHVLFITEDFCDTQKMQDIFTKEDISGKVFDHKSRQEWYKDNNIEEFSHLIPRKSHAETSFGLLYMWKKDFKYGFFIDDDTIPHPNDDFFGKHIQNLGYNGKIKEISSDKNWVNVLYQNIGEHGLYPRGYPYSKMNESVDSRSIKISEVVASQGLWTNVPDLDAIRILIDGDLNGQSETRLYRDSYDDSFVVASNNYLTVCSMNLAFKREIIPVFYQLPMDDNKWNIGRFDDIWSGIFLKKACDILDKNIYNGYPLCKHNKAERSTFNDLKKEVEGLEINEYLWRIIDQIELDTVKKHTVNNSKNNKYMLIYQKIADRLISGSWSKYTNGEFLTFIGKHMKEWTECLRNLKQDKSYKVVDK